jgi:uncharacterized protein (DUF1330 family)
MPKGYVISRVDITSLEAYARYAAAATKSDRRPWRQAAGARRAQRGEALFSFRAISGGAGGG